MKRTVTLKILAAIVLLGGVGARAEEDVVTRVIEACQPEIETYCSQVTPGEGRLLACFYAHEDKLSGRCGWALYEGAAALEDFAAALTSLAERCGEDLIEHCAEVELGEGRVATCLLAHEEEVSAGCAQAIDEVELEVVAEEEEGE